MEMHMNDAAMQLTPTTFVGILGCGDGVQKGVAAFMVLVTLSLLNKDGTKDIEGDRFTSQPILDLLESLTLR